MYTDDQLLAPERYEDWYFHIANSWQGNSRILFERCPYTFGLHEIGTKPPSSTSKSFRRQNRLGVITQQISEETDT